MSQLLSNLVQQLNTLGNFTLYGDDGYIITAYNLKGTYSLEVVNDKGVPELNCYSDLPRILNHVKRHVTFEGKVALACL